MATRIRSRLGPSSSSQLIQNIIILIVVIIDLHHRRPRVNAQSLHLVVPSMNVSKCAEGLRFIVFQESFIISRVCHRRELPEAAATSDDSLDSADKVGDSDMFVNPNRPHPLDIESTSSEESYSDIED